MSAIYLVTDSTADLTKEEISTYAIHVVPLTISIDDESFLDGVTMTKQEFMEKMQHSSQLPKTAQPSIGRFAEVYEALTKDGSSVISIHLMNSISGTVNAARQAADLVVGDVTVVDSSFTSRPQAMIVKAAAVAIQNGATKDEVLDVIKQAMQQSKLYLHIVELENLIKGGRISKAMGAFSNLLNIKLFLEVRDGAIQIVQKGRGLKSLQKKYDEIIHEMQQIPQGIKEIGITHAGLSEFNQAIITQLKNAFPNVPITIEITSPIIMTHTGLGAMALSYITNN